MREEGRKIQNQKLFDYIYKRIGVIFTLQPLAKEPLTLAGDISQLSQPRDSTNTVVEENVYLICMKFDGIKRHQKQSLMGVVLCPIRACQPQFFRVMTHGHLTLARRCVEAKRGSASLFSSVPPFCNLGSLTQSIMNYTQYHLIGDSL